MSSTSIFSALPVAASIGAGSWEGRARRSQGSKIVPRMIYQLGWTTLPGLRGLSVGEFRATPTAAPDNEKGVAVNFASESDRDAFLDHLEEHFAQRRFTNAADAFDTVKAYVLESAAKGSLSS